MRANALGHESLTQKLSIILLLVGTARLGEISICNLTIMGMQLKSLEWR